MASSALQFHLEIEAAVTSNRKSSQYQTLGYRIYPMVGVGLSARLVCQNVEMLRTYEGQALGGDGTVPGVSAISSRIECREWVFEEGDLYVVDEDGEFVGIVDQWSDRDCVREHALHTRQERTFNITVGEKIEIDGYA
jgi:hypothetical protein